MSENNQSEDVCGVSYEHTLRVIDSRDGQISLECQECGAEIFYEGDEW